MGFYRHPDGTNHNTRVPGAVKVEKRKYPPGYVDPEPIQRFQQYLIKKWIAQGKPDTQFRHVLALAVARQVYYTPKMPRYSIKSWQERQWRLMSPEKREKKREHCREIQKISVARRQAAKRVKAQQAELVAQGKLVQRQFRANMEGV